MDQKVAQYKPVSWRSGFVETHESNHKWRPKRWWLGPLIFLPFLIIAALWAISHIQGDVERRAAEVLERNGIDTSELTFNAEYRDVEVGGVLPPGVDPLEVERLLQDDPGHEDDGFDEDDEDGDIRDAWVTATATAATQTSLGATAESDGQTITLEGTVPTDANRNELIEAAESTGLEVNADGLGVFEGAAASDDPDGQISRMGAVIGGLGIGTFTAAQLSIGDDGPVQGQITAIDQQAAGDFVSSVGDGVTVDAPPDLGGLNTDVDFDGERIVLNGTVLTEDQSASLEQAAAGVVGADNVTNNLEVSGLEESVPGADGRVAALGAAIGTFGGLNNADATMNDTDLTVNGEAPDEGSREATVSAVTAAEASELRPGGEITVVEAEISLQEEIDLLQAELDALQDELRENVVFASNSDVLTPAAQGTLDKVVAAMQRYPRPVVEVGGHTDSQGNDEFNLDLSQRRSNSVVEYVGAQTSVDRLSPVGYGEAQPIADNTTEPGRLQNRRVEFIAKESF